MSYKGRSDLSDLIESYRNAPNYRRVIVLGKAINDEFQKQNGEAGYLSRIVKDFLYDGIINI